jgi:hypothetical protein
LSDVYLLTQSNTVFIPASYSLGLAATGRLIADLWLNKVLDTCVLEVGI